MASERNEIVIGYKSYFSKEIIAMNKIEPEDLIDAKFEMQFENVGDIYDELITTNLGICSAFDKETGIATIMFQHEIPYEIYKEYYDYEPIYK